MHEQKQKQYNPAVDLLRIISILAVVFVHTTTKTLEATSYDLQRVPWTLFLNQSFRFAVPVFFLISGFVLELNYHFHENYGNYLKKRFNRILIPYVVWSVIYYFFVYLQHKTNFLLTLLSGSASYQLYFIPALFIFYMIFPLIHNYYKFLTKKWVLIFLGSLEIIFLYYDYHVHRLISFYPLDVAILNYYVFLIGIVSAHHKEKILAFIHNWKIIIFITTVGLADYIYLEGYNLYKQTHNYLSFYSQWRPSVLIYSLLIAGSLYYLLSKMQTHPSWVKTLSRLSFFVFFIHVLILEAIWHTVGITIFQLNIHIAEQLWYDPLFFLSVACISFVIAFIAHKIPQLSKLTG